MNHLEPWRKVNTSAHVKLPNEIFRMFYVGIELKCRLFRAADSIIINHISILLKIMDKTESTFFVSQSLPKTNVRQFLFIFNRIQPSDTPVFVEQNTSAQTQKFHLLPQ